MINCQAGPQDTRLSTCIKISAMAHWWFILLLDYSKTSNTWHQVLFLVWQGDVLYDTVWHNTGLRNRLHPMVIVPVRIW